MYALSLEPTNHCNRNCLHCVRNLADERGSLPLETAKDILSQARTLGFTIICLTGGEVAVYPHLEDLLAAIAALNLQFTLVTNGYRFTERLLPLLVRPDIRGQIAQVFLSLDGAREETHDALRGPGSWGEVIDAAAQCRFNRVKFGFKSTINNYNLEELTDLALLGGVLGAESHEFLYLFPTPRLIEAGAIPDPGELDRRCEWVLASLAQSVRTRISVEGYLCNKLAFNCGSILHTTNVDYQGNLILCCSLSHVTAGEGVPTRFGAEFLADLKQTSLKDGLIRHFRTMARVMEARLRDLDGIDGVTSNLCYWCMRYFKKLDWLKNYPQSPWAAGLPALGSQAA